MSIQDIAKKGRYGDNHLLHVSDAEVQGLNALANNIYGHGLTTNPETGLPEAFLFAPFLAPLFSGAVGGALGLGASSALATGLTAGTLGAAEAAARGMDDPLQQGFMAGLTAGAGQGISNTLGGMGADAASQAAMEGATAGTEAIANPLMDQSLQNAASNAPDLTQSLMSPQIQPQNIGSVADLSMGPQFGQFNAVDMAGGASAPFNTMPVGPQTVPGAPSLTPPAPEPSFMQSAMDKFTPSDQTIAGAKKAFGSQEGFKEFMDKGGQAGLATGLVGIGGQAGLEAQQEQRETLEAQQAERRKKYQDTVDKIRANYAKAGREMPTTTAFGTPVFGGISGFKEGKKVKSPEQQAYEDRTFSTYDEQVADEPWYTRVPVQVLEKMGIRDPYRLQRAMDANKEVDKRAVGGAIGRGKFIDSKTGQPASLAGRIAEVQGLSGSGSAVQGGGSDLDPKVIELLKALKSTGGMKRPGFASGGAITQSDLDDYIAGRGKYANPVTGYTAGGEEIYANKPVGEFMGSSKMGRLMSLAFNPSLLDGYAQPNTGGIDAIQQVKNMQNDPQFLAFKDELRQGAGAQAASEKTGYTGRKLAGGGYLEGGIASLKGDGMSDSVPAKIDGSQPAALSTGEYVIPADVVSHLGNGSSDDGAVRLDEMLDRVRMARTGTEDQAPQIKPEKYLPA